MVRFAKGHGTQNDFVLIDDPDGVLEVDADLVRTICDRRTGLGADGLIRVVRSEAAGAPGEWFMDYRNADGSIAEMCGNGVRVLVAFLARHERIDPGAGTAIGTRAGVRPVRADGDLFAAGMGAWRVAGGPAAVARAGDVTVHVPGLPPLPGLGVDVGNPHVVVLLPDGDALADLDLTVAPVLDPVPVDGANVEFVVPTGESDDGAVAHLAMRVHERGVGETRSCGTGAVAAALAVRAFGAAAGTGPAVDEWQVDLPGGRLRVRVPAGTAATEGGEVELAGPAELVAEGELLLPDRQPQP